MLALCPGCGSSTELPAPCSARAQELVAHTVGVASNRVAAKRSMGNNAMPQCSYTTRLASGKRFSATVNVDTSPQAYPVLARTIEEGQQVFSPVRLVPAPIAVMHLGLLASWFPNQLQLMSTDGVRLIRTTVLWPAARQRQKIDFATRISRMYLKKPKPALAHGYPSG